MDNDYRLEMLRIAELLVAELSRENFEGSTVAELLAELNATYDAD